MAIQNLLYKTCYPVNNYINIRIPSVGEVVDDESNYYGLVSVLTAMPIDMMVQLSDIGVDFTTINDYDLFLIMFNSIKSQDTSLIFGNLDLTKLRFDMNQDNNTVVLVDETNKIIIDRAIHGQIASALRSIHHLEKNIRKPANPEAQAFMIERARKKMRRLQNSRSASHIETLITAMVNTEQYKYDFQTTRDLTIYQFNECVRQVVKKIDYDNRMIGVYAGTVNAKELSQDDLNWLAHK